MYVYMWGGSFRVENLGTKKKLFFTYFNSAAAGHANFNANRYKNEEHARIRKKKTNQTQ